LLLQEYTAEIERLRRDLAATRDKNGVYLASDNYTQMILQLEQQEQEISQMLSHIKALKEEMDKKEASSISSPVLTLLMRYMFL
jgi:kinesin family protein 11